MEKEVAGLENLEQVAKILLMQKTFCFHKYDVKN